MATGWYGRSVAAASLTRLPRGICCGVCGLTEPTPDSTEDGPADTAAAWAAMTRHVLETHCTPCCVCGDAYLSTATSFLLPSSQRVTCILPCAAREGTISLRKVPC